MDAFEEAIQDFSRVIALRPSDAAAWFNRGLAHAGLGLDPRAVDDFTRAATLQPGYAAAYYGRAMAQFRLRAIPAARADLETFRKLGGVPDGEFVKALDAAPESSR